jgi:hypothetical protein
LRQFEEERKAVIASQRLLDELLSKAQEEAVAKAAATNQGSSTTVTFGNQNLSRCCREEVNHGRSLCVFSSKEAARLYIWFDMADMADVADVTELGLSS